MHKLEIGAALIRKIDDRIYWLGKHDVGAVQIDFVIAERLEKEPWREAILREVAWEWNIDRKRDFIVSNMAQLNINIEVVLPGDDVETKVACAFYNVELYRKSTLEVIEQDQRHVWLTSREICEGTTTDGIPLDPLFVMLNNEAKVIQHWESDVLGD
jgi:hypothetical protein